MEALLLLVGAVLLFRPSMISGLFGPSPSSRAAAGSIGGGATPPGYASTVNQSNGGPNLNPIGTTGPQRPGGQVPSQVPPSQASQWGDIIGGVFKLGSSISAAMGTSESPSGSAAPQSPISIDDNGTIGDRYGSQPGEFDGLTGGSSSGGTGDWAGGIAYGGSSSGSSGGNGTIDDLWDNDGSSAGGGSSDPAPTGSYGGGLSDTSDDGTLASMGLDD